MALCAAMRHCPAASTRAGRRLGGLFPLFLKNNGAGKHLGEPSVAPGSVRVRY